MIPLPSTPNLVEKKGDKAVFKIEGLYPGYGVTIGNCLRRVLFSSLEGAAITEVKIKGVQHEFSTVSGVSEDVLRIILNLKQVRCRLHGYDPQKIELSVKGEKEAKAGDFKTPSQVEIINKGLHIASLGKGASLSVEALVEKGVGYVLAEQRKKEKIEIGMIVLDAIFTPIKNVSFRVENMRVGDRTDFDRLLLEIETDGTITPQEAFMQALEILVSHFTHFQPAFSLPKEKVSADSAVKKIKKKETAVKSKAKKAKTGLKKSPRPKTKK